MSIKSISVCGYAKINLHLDMTGRRDDGYHTVNTVMQTVSLCDDVTVTLREDERIFATCNIQGVPTDEKNLAVRAALMLREAVGFSFGVQIDIFKRIPMAAGLAGGSADAAATLVALNVLMGNPCSIDQLCELGSRLGADVPFCIVGGTRFADGKGDILHDFPNMPDCAIVIACEGEGVSTPWAYRRLDEAYGNFEASFGYVPKEMAALKEALQKQDVLKIANTMYNIFEIPVLSERPVAAEIRSLFLSCGALGAMMSGSGPSVFAIFATEADAETAVERLKNRGYCPYLCHPVEC
ncbi:MAG: 4-(cytidine 5'-diphospho)-2-C-methyl-D-erythritol kinase [Clostridia bacterium]|nr:4-(cytidine 5'-diphospho)-2-C-methyl-D-erythritol kinase [Clostridia bacterium]